MKPFILIIFFIAISFTALGCSDGKETINGIPDDYPSDVAVSNGDVVVRNRGIDNLQQFLSFYENVQNQNDDAVRIVRYTTEGDAIIEELDYNGKYISYTYDNSRDQYGSPNIVKSKCEMIDSTITEKDLKFGRPLQVGETLAYFLTKCSSGKDIPLLYIQQHDYPNKIVMDGTSLEMKIENTTFRDFQEKVINVVIKQTGPSETTFGASFRLEKNLGDTWVDVPFNANAAFPAIGLMLHDGEEYKEDIAVERLLEDKLSEGKYRIIKDFNLKGTTATLASEFVVAE